MKFPSRCFIFLICFALDTFAVHAGSLDALQTDDRSKLDPLLQQALFFKEQFPAQAITTLEYYSAGERAAESVGDVIGVLIESSSDIRPFIQSLGGVVGSKHGFIYTALVPTRVITQVAQQKTVRYIEASHRLFLSLDFSRAKTGADVLQSLDPARRLTGKGIIIGFTDSGINTEHPNFRTPDGKTRILYVWDQMAVTGGTPPTGFTYGVEKDSAAINARSWSMSDGRSHGTHVSGIAAGNGLPSKTYIGMAPEADIIMVANIGDDLFNRGVTTVGTLDGYDYIRGKATALRKRFVVNTSQGTNLGPHDGTTLFEKAIDADVAAGGILCLSAGNEATSNRHASAVVTTSSPQEIECSVSSSGVQIPMDIWYKKNDRLELRIKRTSDASYTALFPPKDSTITYSFGSIVATVTTKINSPLNGDNEVYITFLATGGSEQMKLKFSAAPGNTLPDSGKVDLWWERNFSVQFLTNVDRSITLGIPACADSAITVASYNNHPDFGAEDDISNFSGRGPRRDGKIKPDIAGIGGSVVSSVGPSGYASFSGTSMSSPHVAGAVALLLQQDTTLTSYQVKEKLLSAATADGFTGTIPNPTWGYGKLNVLRAAGYRGTPIINVQDSVQFASAFVGMPNDYSLTITNLGNEVLTISAIVTSNPIFTVEKTSLTVPPRAQEKLIVTVAPADTGSFSGTMTISSDDSTRPTTTIMLIGHADFVPVASVAPDSISFTVNEGDGANSTLRIHNSGAGPLKYSIEFDYSTGGTPEASQQGNAISGLWGERMPRDQGLNSVTPKFLSSSLLPLIIKDSIGDASGVHISEIRGQVSGGMLNLQVVLATPLEPSNFAGILGLDIDQNTGTGTKIMVGVTLDVGCEFLLSFSNIQTNGVTLYDSAGSFMGRYVPTIDIGGKNFSFSIPMSTLRNDDGVIDLAGVFGTVAAPTDYVPNSGHGTIRIQWLSADPAAGTVPGGEIASPVVYVNTDFLDAGEFSSKIIVSTNDPAKRTVVIPVRLAVVGSPNLLAPDSIEFLTTYIGFPDTVSVKLMNNGTGTLSISGISFTDTQFSLLGPSSFSLGKNEERTIGIVFSPTAPGGLLAQCLITSNDPGTPAMSIPMTAYGAHPPSIAVSPDSLAVTLKEDDSTAQNITISNTGAGVLNWEYGDAPNSHGAPSPYAALFDRGSHWARGIDSRSSVTHPDARIPYSDRGSLTTLSSSKRSTEASSSIPFFPLFGTTSAGIEQIDPSNGVLIRTYPIPLSAGPDGLAFDGISLYLLAGYTGRIYKIAASTGEITDTIIVSIASDIDGLATDGQLLYVMNYGLSKIYVMDLTTKQIVATLTPDFAIGGGITYAGRRRSLFVSNFSTQIYELDATTGALLRKYPSPAGISIYGVAYSNSADILIVSGSGQTYFLEPTTGIILGSIMEGYSGLAADEASDTFIALEPTYGTIEPEGSQNVSVKINGHHIPPGQYRRLISLRNNDPLHNPKNIPVTLNVVGRPRIVVTPDTMAYGISYLGVNRVDTLYIANIGSEVLSISSITISDTAFHPDKIFFSVPSKGKEKVTISFTPRDTGAFLATLTITSNDSGKLVLSVPIIGITKYAPVITTTPDSFLVSLDEGDSTSKTLMIGNSGRGELRWKIPHGSQSLSQKSKLTGASAQRTEKERSEIQLSQQDQKGGNKGTSTVGPTPISSLLSSSGSIRVLLWTGYTDTTFGGELENTMNAIKEFRTDVTFNLTKVASPELFQIALAQTDVFIMPEQERTNDLATLGTSFASALTWFVQSGRTIIVLDHGYSGYEGATSFLNATGLLTINSLVALPSVIAAVEDSTSPLVDGVFPVFVAMNGSNHHTSPNGKKIVRDHETGQNVVTMRQIGAGRVVYIGMDFFSYNSDMAHLLSNAVGLSANANFITVRPDTGVVQPGTAQEVSLSINARLLRGGDYETSIFIENNDPLRNPKMVPFHLHVIGKPAIALAPDSLTDIAAYINIPRFDTVKVKNIGSDKLTVSNITTSDTILTPNKTSFSVLPGEEENVTLRLIARDSGAFNVSVTIASNDAKKPIVKFALRGLADYPPQFAVEPDSFMVSLAVGDSSQRTMTIKNTGRSPLTWEVARITTLSGPTTKNASTHPARTTHDRLSIQRQQSQGGNNTGLPTISPYSVGALLSSGPSAGSPRILLWTTYCDKSPGGELENTLNAIKQFKSDAYFDTTETFSIPALTSRLASSDVFIMPEQEQLGNLSSFGASFGPALTSFVQNGHTVIILDFSFSGSYSFLNNTGLLTVTTISAGEFTAVVHDTESPLVKGLPPSFFAANGTNYHTSPNGEKIIRELNTGNNIVTYRKVGAGNVVYIGMDFFMYNSDMARLLANAVDLSTSSTAISIEPNAGTIPAGGSQPAAVKFSARYLEQGTYSYSIVLSSNDPGNPLASIPASIEVHLAPITVRYMLNQGLNLISWNLDVQDSVASLFAGVKDNLSAIFAYYNNEERFFIPSNPSASTLGTMDFLHGYWVRMNDTAQLPLTGGHVNSQTPILLSEGYNLVSYLSQKSDSVRSALRTVLENTDVVMSYSTSPLVYDPRIPDEFNTLKLLSPGYGYWIRTKKTDTLIYPPSRSSILGEQAEKRPNNPGVLPTHSREWINLWGSGIRVNNELVPTGTTLKAIDSNGVLCGQGIFFAPGKFAVVPIFRDDTTTAQDEGARPGEHVTLQIADVPLVKKIVWSQFGDVVDLYKVLAGAADDGANIPKVFALHQNYPNPFNPSTTIRYDIPQREHVTLIIYNILGEQVTTLVNGEHPAGYYSIVWNGRTAAGMSSTGIYFARIQAGDNVKTMKMILLK